MTNKYLTKVCALLKAPTQTLSKPKSKNKLGNKPNKYMSKVKIKRQKPHNGDTIYRTHKVK